MSQHHYDELIAQFPAYIQLPRIDRPNRHSRGSLTDVTEKDDLPTG